MKPPHMIPISDVPPAKPWWCQTGTAKYSPAPIVSAGEAGELSYSLAGDTLRLKGPARVLKKIARRLAGLGVGQSNDPYGF